MYPVLRLMWQFYLHRKSPRLPLTGTHVSHHICMPWDIDLWRELNNGRTLTIFDLGRIPLAGRVGLIGALKRNRWGLAIAGASVRYRRRITMFERIEMRSRLLS
ncbi:MAG: acyl-CoA thioesterase, partial [Roseovarius sp.]|uniref:acyl-CoA thioesterase n=1 Tax=Roseovarius sp. TaxID=1486281 RepID=UPI001B4995D7